MSLHPSEHLVAIAGPVGEPRYPEAAPFHPAGPYPEYPFERGNEDAGNEVYGAVRQCLADLGLDKDRLGTPGWNPLGCWIHEGSTVLIKPNLVLGSHPRGGDLDCLITHGSVIRPLLDYVLIASGGRARVVIGDAPLQGTVFEDAVAANGLAALVDWFQRETGLGLSLVDLRQVVTEFDAHHHVRGWREQDGDPRGYREIDLAMDSMLSPIADQSRAFRISNYRVEDTLQYHDERSHRYVVSGSVFDADLIINVPKLKTHAKAGVTLGLKNLVGTVGRKQCLAHHRYGGTAEQGDEYPTSHVLKRCSEGLERAIDRGGPAPVRCALHQLYRASERMIKVLGLDPIRDGGWHGNDTVWRMVVDLVRIAFYGDVEGRMKPEKQRMILTVIDGIIAGEQEGPLEATPKLAGVVIAGLNPLVTDLAGTVLMGYDPGRIPLLREAGAVERWPIFEGRCQDILVQRSGRTMSLSGLREESGLVPFSPPVGWRGHIEWRGERRA